MWRYALRRLAFLPVIMLAVSMITFFMLRVLPGQDPAVLMAGQNARPEDVERIHKILGLDRPIPVQYIDWMTDVLRGDPGNTYIGNRDIREEVQRRLPHSAELVLISLVISFVMGVSFGVISAVKRNSPIDYVVRLFAVMGQSVPDFFLLLLLIVIPWALWNYAPPIGGSKAIWTDPMHNIRMYGPPALILGIGGAAGIMRLQRTTMLEVLRSDYVRTARAKGLSSWGVIVQHAFRNTLTPLVTVLGTSFTLVFAGSVVAERVMGIDGVGVFFVESAIQRDFPVIQFLVLYTAVVVVIANLIVDLSYAYIDPRVRYR
jgi:peptide/nickel transport system permease protein